MLSSGMSTGTPDPLVAYSVTGDSTLTPETLMPYETLRLHPSGLTAIGQARTSQVWRRTEIHRACRARGARSLEMNAASARGTAE